ncbi:MAG: type II secretion system major pseudopilin GspG [bacterium]|nr:type II secretion system major pseudopilin GspG [bacterium]
MKRNRTRTSTGLAEATAATAGFTLVELMVVIVIIGLLVALVGPKLMGAADDAKVVAARAQINGFKSALDMYKLKIGKYPTTSEGLEALVSNSTRNFLDQDKVPDDPWNNPYIYTCPGAQGHDYEIVSYGEDGVQGGTGEYDKDIESWNLAGD